VYGEDYPIGIRRNILSKLIYVAQFAFIGIIFGGESVRGYFSFIPREAFEWIDRKKWVAGLLAFFGGNILQTSLTSTGAFEIFCNGQLVKIYKFNL
jgi:hypothetical protein